jgi:polyisoprenoid-binding protein YceI
VPQRTAEQAEVEALEDLYDPLRRRRRRLLTLFAGGLVALVAVVLGGPWLFFRIEGAAPAPLTLPVGPGGVVGPVNGTWLVTAPSQAQYRVQEILFGQHHTAVGSTTRVSGHLTIKGATVVSAQFRVDMAAVRSNQAGRNIVFEDQLLDTVTYPYGYFTLTKAVDLGRVPAERHQVRVLAIGELTLRGHSRVVRFPLVAERYSNGIDISGSLDIRFTRWGIPRPDIAITEVGSTGTIDVLLHLVRQH